MINFGKEFIIDKKDEKINENIYLNLNEVSIKFKVHIVQEYNKLFKKIRCTSKIKKELKQMNSCFKKILNVLNREILKNSCKRRNELNTISIEEDEDIKFKKCTIENLKNSIFSLDMYFKEFIDIYCFYEKKIIGIEDEITEEEKNVINKKNRPSCENIELHKKKIKFETIKSQEIISNYNQSNDGKVNNIKLKKEFCEKIVLNYNNLFKKFNDAKIKKIYSKQSSNVLEKIEKYLDNVSTNYYLLFLVKRIQITKKVLIELENINQISYNLYSDKIIEVKKNPLRKKSSFSENNKILSYKSKTGISQKFSLQFSKILKKPFSNDVSSMVLEINNVIKEANSNKYPFLIFGNDVNIQEEDDFFSKEDGVSIREEAKPMECYENHRVRVYSCYCRIF